MGFVIFLYIMVFFMLRFVVYRRVHLSIVGVVCCCTPFGSAHGTFPCASQRGGFSLGVKFLVAWLVFNVLC